MSDTLTYASLHARRDRREHALSAALATPSAVWGGIVAVAAFAAYLATLAPDVYSLDSPELAAAAHRLGIAHPPGYPLYTLTGWLFSHAFPIGNVAFRLNLLSAIFGVAACMAVYLLALRLNVRPVFAAAGALSLGFSYYFWSDALAAEVYTLDAALFAGLLLAAFEWRARRTAPRGLWLAAATGLMLGLACATRTTAVLYLPALLAFAWISGERSPLAYGAAAGGLAAGLLFYLYLPIRSATGVTFGPGEYGLDGTLRVWDLASIDGFWGHVTASAFRGEAFAYGPLAALGEAGEFSLMLAASFLAVGLPLGIAGIVRQWRVDRALLLLLGGTALPLTLFFINYGTIDKEFMFLPAYVVWALWMALGMQWAAEAAGAGTPAWLLAGAALAVPAAALLINAPLVSLRGEHRVRDDAEAFLALVPPGGMVYGPFTDTAPLQFLQAVEAERTDVRLVNSWTVDEGFLLALAAANVGQRPFFVTRDEPALRRLYRLAPAGEGFQVLPRAP